MRSAGPGAQRDVPPRGEQRRRRRSPRSRSELFRSSERICSIRAGVSPVLVPWMRIPGNCASGETTSTVRSERWRRVAFGRRSGHARRTRLRGNRASAGSHSSSARPSARGRRRQGVGADPPAAPHLTIACAPYRERQSAPTAAGGETRRSQRRASTPSAPVSGMTALPAAKLKSVAFGSRSTSGSSAASRSAGD